MSCLSKVDVLILLNIYAANETPIKKISSSTLADSIRQRSTIDPIVVKNSGEIIDVLPNVASENDLILTLGAGDVHKIPQKLKNHFAIN